MLSRSDPAPALVAESSCSAAWDSLSAVSASLSALAASCATSGSSGRGRALLLLLCFAAGFYFVQGVAYCFLVATVATSEPIFSMSRARNECLELPFAEDAEASRSERSSQADRLSSR